MLEGLRTRIAAALLPAKSPNGMGPAVPETKAIPKLTGLSFAGQHTGALTYLTDGMEPGRFDAATAFAASAMCYAAMNYRARNVAQAPIRVVRGYGDEREIVPHPIDALLENPNADYSMGDIVQLVQLYTDALGQALMVKDVTLGGDVGRLQPFNATEFESAAADDRFFGRFELLNVRGPRKMRDADEVVFWHLLHPGSDRRHSVSPTEVALAWAGLGETTRRSVSKMLANGMFPSVVIQPHHDWHPGEEEFERFKGMVDAYHTGPENTGKPFTLLGGGTATRVSFALKDMLPDEILDRVEATTAMAFGIHPVILGALVGLRNSPWSQMSEARRQTYEDTIEPLWDWHANILTNQLFRPIESSTELRLAFDTSRITALKPDRSADVATAAAATFWTLDERRQFTGRDAIGGEDGEWVEAVAAEPDLDMGEKATTGDGWHWSKFDLMTKAQESTWEARCASELDHQQDAALAAFDALASEKATAELDVDALLESFARRWNAPDSWAKVVQPLVLSTAKTAVRELDVAFSLLQPGLLGYVDDHSAELVAGLTDTTRSKLRGTLRTGLRKGEGIEQLRKRIEDGGMFSRSRARLIAQTETTAVTNGAQRESLSVYAADTEGVTIEKRWVDTKDSKTRPEHREMARSGWRDIDDAYPNGLQGPSEPGCRCTQAYRVNTES